MYNAIIIRHKKENRKKCTLTPLEFREDFLFLTHPIEMDLSNGLLLSLEGPILNEADSNKPLVLIDSTWRYAEIIAKSVSKMETRTLPHNFKTAYPRKPNPQRGLASIEALFIAFLITKRPLTNLLDHYYWRASFLAANGLAALI